MSTIAERFLLVRGKVKQGDFAKVLEINPNTLRNYENGRVYPNQEVLERICVKFSVCAEWLLLGRGPMHPGEQSIPQLKTPHLAPEQPVISTKTADHCPRCERLETELEEERKERREKDREVRELSVEIRKLWKENSELKERCATLVERQKTCCPELFSKKLGNDPPNNAQICA